MMEKVLSQQKEQVPPGTERSTSTWRTPTTPTVLASKTMNDFRKHKLFCDVNIRTDIIIHPAHRIVLAAFSPFFEAMFSGEFAESNQPTVLLKSIESDAFENILDEAYSGKAEITMNNVHAVLHGANFLQARPLFSKCCGFLEKNLAPENSLGFWKLAEVYPCSRLKAKAMAYSLTNFSEVCEEFEFLEMGTDMLEDIVGNDALDVNQEETVFEAVIRWLYYKEEERAGELEKVLRHVRLAHLDPYFLHDRVMELKCIQQSEGCMRLVEAAMRYFLFPNRRMELQSSITRRRNNSEFVEVLEVMWTSSLLKGTTSCVTEDGQVLTMIERPDDSVEDWILKPSNFKVLAYTPAYDVFRCTHGKSNDWEVLPNKNNEDKRFCIAFSELDDVWYAIGGLYIDNSVSSTVEKCSLVDDFWRPVTPLLEAVYSPAVVSLEGYLYVIGSSDTSCLVRDNALVFYTFLSLMHGGITSHGMKTSKVQRYCPRTDKWSESTPLPKDLCGTIKACALNRRIYVFSESQKQVNAYDVSTTGWGLLAEMTYNFRGGPVIMNGSIYVLSEGPENEDHHLERYSPSTDSWEIFPHFTDQNPWDLTGPYLVRRVVQDVETE